MANEKGPKIIAGATQEMNEAMEDRTLQFKKIELIGDIPKLLAGQEGDELYKILAEAVRQFKAKHGIATPTMQGQPINSPPPPRSMN